MKYNITERAANLFDGEWRSTDRDELMRVYDMSEEEATEICEELAEVERMKAQEEEA